jgi:hypothetical protein
VSIQTILRNRVMAALAVAAGVTLGGLWAQTQLDLRTQSKDVDFTSAIATRPVKTGSVLPGACTVGDLFLNLGALPGQNLFACLSANVWTPQSSGGGTGGTFATQPEAEAGTSAAAYMSPLRTAQAIVAQSPLPAQSGQYYKAASTSGTLITWRRGNNPGDGRFTKTVIFNGSTVSPALNPNGLLVDAACSIGSPSSSGVAAADSSKYPVYRTASSGSTNDSSCLRQFDPNQSTANNPFFSAVHAISRTTNVRFWVGLWRSSAGPTNADNAANAGVGFRFSSAASDTNYQCVLYDGVTQRKTDSGVAASTGQHRFEAQLASSNWFFYIDGTQVCAAQQQDHNPSGSLQFRVDAYSLTAAPLNLDTAYILLEDSSAF